MLSQKSHFYLFFKILLSVYMLPLIQPILKFFIFCTQDFLNLVFKIPYPNSFILTSLSLKIIRHHNWRPPNKKWWRNKQLIWKVNLISFILLHFFFFLCARKLLKIVWHVRWFILIDIYNYFYDDLSRYWAVFVYNLIEFGFVSFIVHEM